MTSTWKHVAVALALAAAPSWPAAAEPAPVKTITFVNMEAVDSNLLERVRGYVQGELGFPVKSVVLPKADSATLDEYGKILTSRKGANDVCLIAWVSPGKDIPAHSAVNTNLQIAVVNVKALACPDKEKEARRLERQAMRSVAFLLGMDPCPEPFCVTRNYASLEDLDRMGRNFSPPWKEKVLAEAQKRGLVPLPEPPPRRKK